MAKIGGEKTVAKQLLFDSIGDTPLHTQNSFYCAILQTFENKFEKCP
jgi:hypothetical protein